MDIQELQPGMLLRVKAGKGTYKTDLYGAILRVISVNTAHDKVQGFQYKILAERQAGEASTHFQFKKNDVQVISIPGQFNSWCKAFNPKILV